MNHLIKVGLLGVFFGIVMSQSQVVSWYRIQEMFHFQSFHMYGIIGSAIGVGLLFHLLIKKYKVKDLAGDPIVIADKAKSIPRYLFGGILFGLGWALSGACPGPMAVLIGQGYMPLVVVMASAVLGTYIYGAIRHKLPH